MVELKESQVQYIEERLWDAGIRNRDLEEELLDHLCCFVEGQIAEGETFYRAVDLAFDTFRKDEMQELQAQIISIHSKKRFMMKVSLLVLAVLMVFSGFLGDRSPKEPPIAVNVAPTTLFRWKPPSISPLSGSHTITSGFGMRLHPALQKKTLHQGVDLKARAGTPILATADGRVEVSTFDEQYGNYIIIRHDSAFQTLYAHLSELLVKVDQTVVRGDVIGRVGSTGASSLGPHLHYEVIVDGRREDPEKYMGKRNH